MSASAPTPPVHLPDATRPTAVAGVSALAAGPVCIVCGIPFIWPVLGALGLSGAAFAAHYLSWFLAPVVVLLLSRNARRHHDRRPLRVAAAGGVVYLVHTVLHFAGGSDLLFVLTDQVGVALLGAGALWDLAVTRRTRRAHGVRASKVHQQNRPGLEGARP